MTTTNTPDTITITTEEGHEVVRHGQSMLSGMAEIRNLAAQAASTQA